MMSRFSTIVFILKQAAAHRHQYCRQSADRAELDFPIAARVAQKPEGNREPGQ